MYAQIDIYTVNVYNAHSHGNNACINIFKLSKFKSNLIYLI